MKIGIITFHASFNYGSMLQAWALQTYLEKKDNRVEIVNYRSHIQKVIYHKPISFARKDVFLATLKRLFLYPSSIKPLYKKWYLFDAFLHEKLNISKEYPTIKDLETSEFDYNMLICGSDQIWNASAPDATEAYYGNWFHGTKIAYAASMGQYPEKNAIDYYKRQINKFAAISVREEKARNILSNKVGVESVEVVCDPTLLLNGRDFDRLITDEPIIKEPYIFFYTPVGLPFKYFDIVSKLGKDLGLKVITERAYYSKDIRKFGIDEYLPTGPEEFLNLIKNATVVCGGSFHLQVFSILFHKDFYCINGDKDARTNNLLTKVGLQDRIISLEQPNERCQLHVNYTDVDKRLVEYRDTSEKWLLRQVNSTYSIQ